MAALLASWAADRGWRLDQKPEPRALYERRRTLARLEAFLGHGDAAAVFKADAGRWKADMQARGLSVATVRNDLSEMSAVWRHGLANALLLEASGNPFAGLVPPKPRKAARQVRPFTQVEAATLLEAARRETGFLRWAPWVLCLTGARIAEIVQSAKEDVAAQDGIPVICIHDEGDEGRSLKNADSKRAVPLHPALIAEGFLSYVAALPPGSPLFPDVPLDKVFGQRAPNASKRLARWVRQDCGIADPRVSPAHSWRHWFIDACRAIAMPQEIRSALTGHAAKADESAGYGAGMGSFIAVLAEHLGKVSPPHTRASG